MALPSNKYRGVALFQVLIFTAIMAIVALHFSYQARNHVAIAKSYQDRLQAELEYKKVTNILMSTLFQYDPVDLQGKVTQGVKWNFRGQPFKVADAEVTIQAAVGLLSLFSATKRDWIKLLSYIQMSEQEASRIFEELQDWQDKDERQRRLGAEQFAYAGDLFQRPRNGPMQDVSEFALLSSLTEEQYSQLDSLVTTYPTPFFNPALAPGSLLQALYGEEVAEQIEIQRAGGVLSERKWISIAGSQNLEGVFFHPSNVYQISVRIEKGEAQITRTFDLKLQTNQNYAPFLIMRQQ